MRKLYFSLKFGSISGYLDNSSVQHAEYFCSWSHLSINMAVGVGKTYVIHILFYRNFLYSVLVVQHLYNILRPYAVEFTFLHCMYIFKVIRWGLPALRNLISVYILVLL